MIFLAGHISNYSQFSVALADMLQPLFNLVTITSVYRSIMYQILKTIIHYSICCEAQTKCIFLVSKARLGLAGIFWELLFASLHDLSLNLFHCSQP